MFKTVFASIVLVALGGVAVAQDTFSSVGVDNLGRLSAGGGFCGGQGFVDARTLGWANFARSTAVSYGPDGLDVSFSYGFDRPGATTARHFSLGARGGQVFHGQSLMTTSSPGIRQAGAGGRIGWNGPRIGGDAWGTGQAAPFGSISGYSFTRQSPDWLP